MACRQLYSQGVPVKELQEANRGFVEAWSFFVERFPAGTVEKSDGWTATLGHVPIAFFNMFFLNSPLESDDEFRGSLARVAGRASRLGHPWFLSVCEEWTPPSRDRLCLETGLVPAMKLIAMATDELAAPRRPAPPLEYRRVADVETSKLMAEINAAAYGMPAEAAEALSIPAIWDENTFGYVGFDGDLAVTCAATVVVGDLLYAAWVATLPDYQRRGYAEAVMRKSLEEAGKATGLARTLLHATEAGRPVYSAMDYRDTATFTLYCPPREGH